MRTRIRERFKHSIRCIRLHRDSDVDVEPPLVDFSLDVDRARGHGAGHGTIPGAAPVHSATQI